MIMKFDASIFCETPAAIPIYRLVMGAFCVSEQRRPCYTIPPERTFPASVCLKNFLSQNFSQFRDGPSQIGAESMLLGTLL